MKSGYVLVGLVLGWLLNAAVLGAGVPHVVKSADGTPVSYEVSGAGEPVLVFVHGWSCDARYWREQVPEFAKRHEVVTIDLAGHGHSGTGRDDYTMAAFGEDVKAVVDAVGATNVILIGHSMGGAVIGEAARLMPKKVVGLIGVDTLQNVEHPLTQDQMDGMLAPLRQDFTAGCNGFVGSMMNAEYNNPALRAWILADMASAPPRVAMSAIDNMMTLYVTGDFAKIFDGLEVPVICVNADKWPANAEANRQHMQSFEEIVVPGADHFLQLDRPGEFNPALAEAIGQLVGGA
jgi:pimeloyl-ACP methyl ester carboxylesterase